MISILPADNNVMDNDKSISRFRYNRVIVFQALSCVVALSLSWAFVYIPQYNDILKTLFCMHFRVFACLQVFWNIVIRRYTYCSNTT
jgi:hypothetical protein